jgi:hypothetical protein
VQQSRPSGRIFISRPFLQRLSETVAKVHCGFLKLRNDPCLQIFGWNEARERPGQSRKSPFAQNRKTSSHRPPFGARAGRHGILMPSACFSQLRRTFSHASVEACVSAPSGAGGARGGPAGRGTGTGVRLRDSPRTHHDRGIRVTGAARPTGKRRAPLPARSAAAGEVFL